LGISGQFAEQTSEDNAGLGRRPSGGKGDRRWREGDRKVSRQATSERSLVCVCVRETDGEATRQRKEGERRGSCGGGRKARSVRERDGQRRGGREIKGAHRRKDRIDASNESK